MPKLAPVKVPPEHAHGQGTGLGRGAGAALVNAGFNHIGRIIGLLERITAAVELAGDYDTSFVVGGLQTGAAVQSIQLPRTINHVELSLYVDTSTPLSVAVFAGNVTLTDAQARHAAAGPTGPSNALCSSSGSKVTVRCRTGNAGYLTVFFTAAGTTFATVRVRSLDHTQNVKRHS